MIALALLSLLVQQDTNTTLSPRIRGMLDRFPPPRTGNPSISIAFSRDTVWVGEQVELVTAAWFPRALRDRLRHQPRLHGPALSGLWSARSQQTPIPARTVIVGRQLYDLFITYQTIFPLGPGRITAPPAEISYGVPTSTSYFAPEEPKTFVSSAASLVVRAFPAAIARGLNSGPTAHNLRVVWRGPAGGLRAGAPGIVELSVSGEGNVALWPAPQISWPPGIRIYPEPTEEHFAPSQGLIAGEKRFRFTVVADSAGVLTLPSVSYTYFDPATATVEPAVATALSMPIMAAATGVAVREPIPIVTAVDVPVATTVVRSWWPLLLALSLLPLVLWLWSRRPRRHRPAAIALTDTELALRAALGAPIDAGPDRVVAALRARGIARDDAEHIHRWLSARNRKRYGPHQSEDVDPPAILRQVLLRLTQVVVLVLLAGTGRRLGAQQASGVERFGGADYAGAARAFQAQLLETPHAAGTWRDLGAARWMQNDDVGAAAAWLVALSLTPRDPVLVGEWRDLAAVPADVRDLEPDIPLSRDELLLVALVLWLVAAGAWAAQRPRTAYAVAGVAVLALIVAAGRTKAARARRALIVANAPLHISPNAATRTLGDAPAWSLVRVVRRESDWILVSTQLQSPGAVAATSTEGWVPAASIAPIGPLD